jgi:hypothetical protein
MSTPVIIRRVRSRVQAQRTRIGVNAYLSSRGALSPAVFFRSRRSIGVLRRAFFGQSGTLLTTNELVTGATLLASPASGWDCGRCLSRAHMTEDTRAKRLLNIRGITSSRERYGRLDKAEG